MDSWIMFQLANYKHVRHCAVSRNGMVSQGEALEKNKAVTRVYHLYLLQVLAKLSILRLSSYFYLLRYRFVIVSVMIPFQAKGKLVNNTFWRTLCNNRKCKYGFTYSVHRLINVGYLIFRNRSSKCFLSVGLVLYIH